MANYIKVTTAPQESGVIEPHPDVQYASKEVAIQFAEHNAGALISSLREFSQISGIPLRINEADIKAAYKKDYPREEQSVLKIDLGAGPRIIPINETTSEEIDEAVKRITLTTAIKPIAAPVHAVRDELKKIGYEMLDQLSVQLDKIATEYPTQEAQQQLPQIASPKPVRHR